MLVVILPASFPCRGLFSQREAGHFDKADLMQLLIQGYLKMSVLNVKDRFWLPSYIRNSHPWPSPYPWPFLPENRPAFVLIFSTFNVCGKSLWDLGLFFKHSLSSRFPVKVLHDIYPIIHILMRPLALLLHLIYIVQGIYTFLFCLTHYCYLKLIVYSDFLRFYLLLFTCSKIPSRISHYIQLTCFLRFL